MKDWLEKFALSQQTPKMKKTASQVIVNKADLVDACDGDIVSYDDAQYKVVDCNYSDDKGDGVVLEKCAALEGDPMEVAMGTSADYQTNPDMTEQEYARKETVENVDTGAEEAEVAKFTEDAAATEETIAQEDAIDGTTGFNHPNRILQRIIDKYAVNPDTTIVDEINNEEAKVVEPEDYIVDEYTDVDFEIEEPVTLDEEKEAEPIEEEVFEVPDTTLVAKDMRKKRIARK